MSSETTTQPLYAVNAEARTRRLMSGASRRQAAARRIPLRRCRAHAAHRARRRRGLRCVMIEIRLVEIKELARVGTCRSTAATTLRACCRAAPVSRRVPQLDQAARHSARRITRHVTLSISSNISTFTEAICQDPQQAIRSSSPSVSPDGKPAKTAYAEAFGCSSAPQRQR